jgi:hypothetical protein
MQLKHNNNTLAFLCNCVFVVQHLVMEFVIGGDCASLLANLGQFDLSMTTVYAAQVTINFALHINRFLMVFVRSSSRSFARSSICTQRALCIVTSSLVTIERARSRVIRLVLFHIHLLRFLRLDNLLITGQVRFSSSLSCLL